MDFQHILVFNIKDNEFCFVDPDSQIHLADQKSYILLAKTGLPVYEKANDTVLATSRVVDNSRLWGFDFCGFRKS